jgi:hypothetical protein
VGGVVVAAVVGRCGKTVEKEVIFSKHNFRGN